MKTLPQISIVIPSYNKVDYIKHTLDSIIRQAYPNLEVIIQDGGSTDGSLKIIKEYTRKYPKIFQFESKKDKGQLDAINKALRRVKGSIVSFINADDIYEKKALFKVAKAFNNNPEILWVAGYGKIINDKEDEVSPWVNTYKNFLLRLNKYPLLLMTNYLMQPSVFIKRSILDESGYFTGENDYVMEYEMWLRLAKSEMPYVIQSALSSFRIAAKSISKNRYNETLREDYKIARKYTSNYLLLILHKLHNWGRGILVTGI